MCKYFGLVRVLLDGASRRWVVVVVVLDDYGWCGMVYGGLNDAGWYGIAWGGIKWCCMLLNIARYWRCDVGWCAGGASFH